MSEEVLSRIEATVLTKTKEALLKHCASTGLTIGEVIDRTTLGFTVDDPELAANLICEDFILMAANQTNGQIRQTLINIVALL